MPDIDIFSEDAVEVLNINAREIYPEILPVLPGENPFDVDPEDEEEASVDYGDVIDYGEYDLRNPPAVEPELEYVSDVLQNSPYIGVPINAFRVLLGSYTFAYGAKTDISVTTSQVIVKFPVVNRDGSLKQTTGAGDTEYEWEGHIKVNDVHKDLEAIKKIEALGEPVDFYYMSQKKKVLVESFDYKIIDNCNATYKIKVTEYYPQKIKAIPVRIDPLFPDRWGFIPPLLPGDELPGDDSDDEEKRPECQCSLSLDWTGEWESHTAAKITNPYAPYPQGLNPSDQIDKLLGSLTGWLERSTDFLTISKDAIMQRIFDYMTKLLLRSQSNNLGCLFYLFQVCPKLQEYFYRQIVGSAVFNGVFIQDKNPDGTFRYYRLMYFDENGELVLGHSGNKQTRSTAIREWFWNTGNVVSWKAPYDKHSIWSMDCSKILDYLVLAEGVTTEEATKKCYALKAIMKEFEPTGAFSGEIDIATLLARLRGGKGVVYFRIPQLVMSEECQKWCNTNANKFS